MKNRNKDERDTEEIPVIKEEPKKKHGYGPAIAVLVIVVAIAGVSGYIFKKKNDASPAPTVSAVSTASASPTASANPYWIVEPGMAMDDLMILTTSTYSDSSDTSTWEKTGMPVNWDDGMKDAYATPFVGISRYGALEVQDFDGNEVFQANVTFDQDKISYDAVDHCFIYSDGDAVYRISRDFSTLSEFTTSSSKALKDIGFVMLDDKLVYVEHGKDGKTASIVSDKTYDASGHRAIVPVVDSSFAMTGYKVLDESGNALADGSSGMVVKDTFVNGYYAVEEKSQDGSSLLTDKDGLMAIVKADTGEAITSYIYQDVLYFEDGYCPAKRDDKWGFIDETGKEVIPCAFDAVSYTANGHAYVCHDGQWGILNLDALKSNAFVTVDDLFPSAVQETVSGTVTVLADNLNVREKPSSAANAVDLVYKDESYPFDAMMENGGYTWYRIGENEWIADKDGEYLQVEKNEG